MFSHSYYTLTVWHQLSDGRNYPRSDYEPRKLGSGGAPLMARLSGGRHEVKLTTGEGIGGTGWPRGIAPPGLPQTRTCAINAFGSSSNTFASRRRIVVSSPVIAIRRPCVDTSWEVGASGVFPSGGVVTRRPASLPRVLDGAAPAMSTTKAPAILAFAALSHGFGTGCLRFVGRVAPTATQDSLPAVGRTLPDGLGCPQGSNERFQSVPYISASFPKFNVAQGQSHFRRTRIGTIPRFGNP
jgi:hypothetical protein